MCYVGYAQKIITKLSLKARALTVKPNPKPSKFFNSPKALGIDPDTDVLSRIRYRSVGTSPNSEGIDPIIPGHDEMFNDFKLGSNPSSDGILDFRLGNLESIEILHLKE